MHDASAKVGLLNEKLLSQSVGLATTQTDPNPTIAPQTAAGGDGYVQQANFQLARFLKFSEEGEVTLLIPKLSEVCRKILHAMTTRQLVNLADRRHVSVLDCPSLTKPELQNLVKTTAAIPDGQLYVDLDNRSSDSGCTTIISHGAGCCASRAHGVSERARGGSAEVLRQGEADQEADRALGWEGAEEGHALGHGETDAADRPRAAERSGGAPTEPNAVASKARESTWMDRARGSVSRNGQPELWFTVGFPDGDLTEERGADGAKSAATENQPARRAPASVRTEIKQIQSSGVSTPQAGSSVYAPVPALRQAGSAPVPALVQSVGSKSMEQSLHEIFVVADKNGNGSLSRAELILRLRKDSELAALLKLPASGMDGERGAFEQVFHRMMDNMDTDSSVSAKEFVRHLSSEVAVAEEPQPQRWQKQIEDELRTMLIEAKDAAATANSAALAIVKRQVAPPRPGIPSPLVGITLAPKDSKIEEVNKLLMVKLKKQETQVMRLARQLDDMRVDLQRVQWDNSNPELAQELSRSSAKSKAAAALKPAEDAEPKQDPVSQAAFRQAASKNQISTMKMMFSEGGMDVDGRDDYGWADGGLADGLAISKCGLKGFTALHHAAFGDSGVSLDAMRQLLLWDCNMNVKDAAGITARGYAVDPRAAALLDLASGNYKPQSVDEGFDDPVLLPNLSGFEGVDRVRILIGE